MPSAGPDGLEAIARSAIASAAHIPAAQAVKTGGVFFDTVKVECNADDILEKADALGFNFRKLSDNAVTVTFDETTEDAEAVAAVFGARVEQADPADVIGRLARTSEFPTHPVFNRYHTEAEMLRCIRRLEAKGSVAHHLR